jgi:hypothetical protein
MPASPENPDKDKDNLTEPIPDPIIGADTVYRQVKWLLANRSGGAIDFVPDADGSITTPLVSSEWLSRVAGRKGPEEIDVDSELWHKELPREEGEQTENQPETSPDDSSKPS